MLHHPWEIEIHATYVRDRMAAAATERRVASPAAAAATSLPATAAGPDRPVSPLVRARLALGLLLVAAGRRLVGVAPDSDGRSAAWATAERRPLTEARSPRTAVL